MGAYAYAEALEGQQALVRAMTDAEIAKLVADAQTEFNANEPVMLVPPLSIIGLVERLQRCERAREAAGIYDELHDA